MFEKLIESDSEGAEFKKRKSYFMVSSVVVGILFITAVVISIYAADYSLGSTTFELSQIVSPEEITPVEPDEIRPRTSRTTSETSQLPTRQVNMLRPDEVPTVVPTGVSVTPNTQASRPAGKFDIGPIDSNPTGSGPVQRNPGGGTGEPGLARRSEPSVEKEPEAETPPPPVNKVPPIKRMVSDGVVNGKATSLPKPTYSAAARAVGAQGQVHVQVTIDEQGRVIAANAVSGHVLLRPEAEKAARNARFTPTELSRVPVKVTGVIIYNFTR